jgi:hypothetical protein
MRSKFIPLTLLVLLVAACVIAPVLLHRYNTRLRERIASERQRSSQLAILREENERLRKLAAHARAAGENSPRLTTELAEARAELATLEATARTQHAAATAQAAADARDLTTNRDPVAGLTRLEHFRNVGHATPVAAIQTLVWAAINRDEAILAQSIALSEQARSLGADIISRLNDSGRAQAPTPESLAGLTLSSALLRVTAIQIVGETRSSPTHAAITVRGIADKDQTFPIELGATGWRVMLPDKFVQGFRRSENTKRESANVSHNPP